MAVNSKALVGCLVTAGLAAGASLASGGGTAGAGNVAGGFWLKYRNVPVYFSGVNDSRTLMAGDWGSDQLRRTVMNPYLVGSHHSTNSISVVDERYPDTFTGQWSCQTWYSSPPDTWVYCQHGHVRFNLAQLSGLSDQYWKHVGCQEMGHAAGLDHRSSGGTCMIQGAYTTALDSHDINIVNFIH